MWIRTEDMDQQDPNTCHPETGNVIISMNRGEIHAGERRGLGCGPTSADVGPQLSPRLLEDTPEGIVIGQDATGVRTSWDNGKGKRARESRLGLVPAN